MCPVCRTTLSLRWSGEIKVLRKHAVGDEPCPGSDHPAVGELPELHLTRAMPANGDRAEAERAGGEERIASVA